MNEQVQQSPQREAAMKAIQEAMGKVAYKEAFLLACERAPELVIAESDPWSFISFDHGNAEAAARRLARYWHLRKEHFGERAFLPMDLSGDGALSKEDLELFGQGYMLRLPDDEKKRVVFYLDTSKRVKTCDPTAVCRIVFFAIHSAFFQEFVVLFNVSNPQAQISRAVLKFTAHLLKDLPTILHHNHVVSRLYGPRDEERLQAIKEEEAAVKTTMGEQTTLHVATSDEDCLEKLAAQDLVARSLPVAFGGTWTGCEPWKTAKDRVEDLFVELDHECLIRNALWYYKQSAMADVPSPQYHGASSSDEDAHKVKRRKLNTMYSKRRRAKQRIEIDGMQQQYFRLMGRNQSLKREQEWLTRLIHAANDAVGHQEG